MFLNSLDPDLRWGDASMLSVMRRGMGRACEARLAAPARQPIVELPGADVVFIVHPGFFRDRI